MTATEELRRMLDERGVEWSAPDSRLHDVKTRWAANGFDYTALEDPSGKAVDLIADYQEGPIAPEQAIAATLGRGTCQVDVLNTGDCAGYECSEYIMHCNACGHEFGHVLYNEDGDVWMSEPPNYCPNCGRRVVAGDES